MLLTAPHIPSPVPALERAVILGLSREGVTLFQHRNAQGLVIPE